MKKASLRTERWLEKYYEPNPLKRQYVSSQVANAFELQVHTDNIIKSILSESAVSTIFNIPYLNFGRKIQALARKYAGKQLQTEIDFLMSKAQAQGLNKEILEKILTAILNMSKATEN
ncbi:MAG: hypothetical protein ABIK61_04835 [candidate division WOR-3 bacterium]